MIRKKLILIMSCIIFVFSISSANACTGILLQGTSGEVVHGRTLEFTQDLNAEIVFIPQGQQFTGQTSMESGLSYTSKYAMLGVIGFHKPIIMDGINEKGLGVAAFYFSKTAEYAEVTRDNRSKALSPVDFPNWILSQFASLEDVKRAIKNEDVVVVDTKMEEWGSDAAPPFHYVVYDDKGNSIVIEPIEGRLVVKDNYWGVITNDPAFDWHETNIHNYISLSPEVVDSIDVKGHTIEALGLGNGMLGLPGDFTSPSRFVRAWAFSQAAPPFKSSEEGIFQVFHILNNFDIPPGITRHEEMDWKTEEVEGKNEKTWLTVARDPQNLSFYYRTYNDQTIRVVYMNSFDKKGRKILKLDTENTNQPVTNMSGKLQ